MTDKPNLAEARRVTEAATRGPWTFSDTTDVRGHKGEFRAPSPDNGFMLVGPWCNDDDAEFIAASRTLVPALLAAVDAVLAVHVPCDNDAARTPICETCHGKAGVWECGCWADEDRVPVCSTCTEVDRVHGGHGATPWPCPTVRAVMDHMEVR